MVCLLADVQPAEDALLASFLNFLPDNERKTMQEALSGYLPIVQEQVMLIFAHFNFSKIPQQGTLRQHLLSLAYTTLVAGPFISYPK